MMLLVEINNSHKVSLAVKAKQTTAGGKTQKPVTLELMAIHSIASSVLLACPH